MGGPSQYAHSNFQRHPEAAALLIAASSLPSPVHVFAVLLCCLQQLEATLGKSLMWPITLSCRWAAVYSCDAGA